MFAEAFGGAFQNGLMLRIQTGKGIPAGLAVFLECFQLVFVGLADQVVGQAGCLFAKLPEIIVQCLLPCLQ
ncbi:hypothetical protein [Aliamphritea spongicola]|nr:hypothetical protein [Aliamphritea spongicola]